MKIRHKLITLTLLYIAGIGTITFMSIISRLKADEIQASLDLGAELQLRSREVQSHMKDIVFDLFAPKMYNQIRSLTFSPRSAVTLKQWQEALHEYNRTFDEFMKLDHFFTSGDSLIRDQYLTAITMNDRANEMLTNMEDRLIILRSQYRTVDNLYNEMQKEESLIPFFNEFQETSYYFKNSFESFMNYFIDSLKEEGSDIQRRIYVSYLITSLMTLFISLLFTFLLSRDLVSKLKKVEISLRLVAKGNFSDKVDIQSNDEFGEFASTFNELISELKENVNSILNLTRDIGGNITENPDVDEMYGLVATAVIEDTAADTVVVLKKEKADGYTTVSVKGTDLTEKEETSLLKHFSNKALRRNSHIYLEKAWEELSCDTVKTLLAVPLLVEGKSFGFLISIKRGAEDRFSDLGITRLATFAEYASMTINNYFQLQELLETRDARYQALQSQVQPHFLYNILGVILGLNRGGEQEKIRDTVSALKDMLRYIQSQNNWTSLEEECQFIEKYCLLQKIRFGDRINYSITLDDETRHIQIPRLLLQPLAENSIIHGLEPIEEGGELTINCESTRIRGEKGVIIHMKDNGVGFEDDGLDRKMNVGLLNVQQRLKIAYPESLFSIKSRINGGTDIRIEI